MSELVPLNILIADRTYRIKTAPSDEEHVRKTVKIINDKILEFKTQFAGKDLQDYISMVLIWFATQTTGQSGEMTGKISDISTALSDLEEQLDKLL